MIFKEYQEYITEQIIDLSLYMGDNDSSKDFHENFFNETTSEGFFDGLNIWKKGNDDSSGLIGRLSSESVEHVLLIMPRPFIQQLIKKDREHSKTRKAPRVAMQEFIENFTNEFTKNGINCSLIINGSHQSENTEDLEQWLNLKELKQTLNLNDNEAYLLGFKELKVSNDSDDSDQNAIAISTGKHKTILQEECSMLVGNSNIFKYNTPSLDGIVKITNNAMDGYIDFLTEHINNVKSKHKNLQEEYFDDEYFAEFSVDLKDLKQNDIDITFDTVKLLFSTKLPKRETTQEEAHISAPIQAEATIPAKGIVSDTDEPQRSTFMNLKDKHLVYLNRITTPIESDLLEIHYHVVKLGSKLIIVGGKDVHSHVNALAKIVANIQEQTFTLTNLSTIPLQFELTEGIATYQVQKAIVAETKTIATDVDTEDTQENLHISVEAKDSHTFNQSLRFSHSALSFVAQGVEVQYINFAITSFSDRFELNRLSLTHFGTGNIIDADENLLHAGRIYTDSKKNTILGAAISRQPLVLSLEGNEFSLYNDIKEAYSVNLHTSHRDAEVPYQETLCFSKDELLSSKNSLGIRKNGVTLLEVSIMQN